MKILLIDDDLNLLKLYAEILENHGYNVTFCDHMAAGLSHIRRDHDWDLIISDYNNPVTEGGVQIVKAAREHTPGTPVMIITGNVISWDDVKMKCDADAYLEKPFRLATLLDVIENCLRSRHQPLAVAP